MEESKKQFLFNKAEEALEDYTGNNLKKTDKKRRGKFHLNCPFLMRMAFYNVFKNNCKTKNFKGLPLSKFLNVDHTTGIYYDKQEDTILFNDDEFKENYLILKKVLAESLIPYIEIELN